MLLVLLASAFSYRSQLFEQAAARLGIEVVKGEDVPPPMLGKVNVPLPLDYRDIPRSARLIERYAKNHPVGAIIGLDDSGTLIAAAASARLGLPYNALEAARAARDKHLMRQRFAEAGVPSPKFRLYHLSEDPKAIAARNRYPCVIKPTNLAGSRGVMRADNPKEFLERLERLRHILATERCDEFLVEDFIPGFEVALEGLLDNGKLHVLALFDKPDPLDGPFFEETIYVTPSRLPDETHQAVFDTTTRAAAALGLRQGPVHAELRVNSGGPWMVEIAARSIGGNCSKALRFDTNVTHQNISLEELILRQAFGMPFNPQREKQADGVMMIPIRESGILTKVVGCEEARKVPLIEDVEITVQPNHPLAALPEGDSYLGFIFARGETPEAVEAAIREAHSKLGFEITPELPLIGAQ